MRVEECSDTEIRIPFEVGEDRSRTWILTMSERGLLFKHDHRHPGGTPDDITMYGGWSAAGGTAYRQEFPADSETADLLPEAETNVWMLEIDQENRRFTYYVERHRQPRYKAVFMMHVIE